MTAKLAFLALALAALPAAAAERSFAVGNFQEVHVSGPDDVTVVSGGAPKVVAIGNQRDLDRVTAEVRDGRLEIGRITGRDRMFNWSRGVKVRVTVPSIHAASLTGSGSVAVDRLKGEAVSAAVTGSGNLNVAMADARTVSLESRGSGGLTAAGRCVTADISARGSGGIDADKLACQAVTVSVAGSGGVSATASRDARVSVSGSGSAIVGGNPTNCAATTRGSGTARCR